MIIKSLLNNYNLLSKFINFSFILSFININQFWLWYTQINYYQRLFNSLSISVIQIKIIFTVVIVFAISELSSWWLLKVYLKPESISATKFNFWCCQIRQNQQLPLARYKSQKRKPNRNEGKTRSSVYLLCVENGIKLDATTASCQRLPLNLNGTEIICHNKAVTEFEVKIYHNCLHISYI